MGAWNDDGLNTNAWMPSWNAFSATCPAAGRIRPAPDLRRYTVVYVAHEAQIEGLQASLFSLVAAAARPDFLDVYVLVRSGSTLPLEKLLCTDAGWRGARIRILPFDADRTLPASITAEEQAA